MKTHRSYCADDSGDDVCDCSNDGVDSATDGRENGSLTESQTVSGDAGKERWRYDKPLLIRLNQEGRLEGDGCGWSWIAS
jgi:hypothetical protein